jgi:AbrB family looped-hinge helix DNA binding protein
MPAIVAKRPKTPGSVDIVRGFLGTAVHYGLLNEWLTGLVGELEHGADPVDAACTSAEEWDFGGPIGAFGGTEEDVRLQSAVLTERRQLAIPREVCDDLNLAVGDRVEFVRTIDGHYLLLPALRRC